MFNILIKECLWRRRSIASYYIYLKCSSCSSGKVFSLFLESLRCSSRVSSWRKTQTFKMPTWKMHSSSIFLSEEIHITSHLWYSVVSLTLNLSNTTVRTGKDTFHWFHASVSHDVLHPSSVYAECYSVIHEALISQMEVEKSPISLYFWAYLHV